MSFEEFGKMADNLFRIMENLANPTRTVMPERKSGISPNWKSARPKGASKPCIQFTRDNYDDVTKWLLKQKEVTSIDHASDGVSVAFIRHNDDLKYSDWIVVEDSLIVFYSDEEFNNQYVINDQ